jgi:hypothetical protein
MGFLQQDSNNTIIDAVLTDAGRQKLAAGTFNVTKFAVGDDEVDYGMITRYGRTVGQEKIEKNTPVFEAITQSRLALVHPIISLPDPNRYTLPKLSLSAQTQLVALGTGKTTHTSVAVTQTLTGTESVPQELVDNQFMVLCDDRFVQIGGYTPTIDRSRMATYLVVRSAALTGQQGASLSLDVIAKSITDAMFLIYGAPTASTTTNKTIINTLVRVTGMSSGSVVEFTVQITKNA